MTYRINKKEITNILSTNISSIFIGDYSWKYNKTLIIIICKVIIKINFWCTSD